MRWFRLNLPSSDMGCEGRAGRGRAGQGRAGQGWAGQGRAGQGGAGGAGLDRTAETQPTEHFLWAVMQPLLQPLSLLLPVILIFDRLCYPDTATATTAAASTTASPRTMHVPCPGCAQLAWSPVTCITDWLPGCACACCKTDHPAVLLEYLMMMMYIWHFVLQLSSSRLPKTLKPYLALYFCITVPDCPDLP